MTQKLLFPNPKFECKLCDYYTDKKSSYTKHLTTAKHKMVTHGDMTKPDSIVCVCGKGFTYRQGLSRHKKSCRPDIKVANSISLDEPTEVQILSKTIMNLVHQNNDFKQLLIEQNKQMLEMAGNAGNNHHNTNSNNKFNLNFFLNETCKDAITMNDFIQTMEVTIEDFVSTGKLGFVDGISKVIVERMKEMEMHTRPMHCTDLKRETIYIKDDSKWEKDDDNKVLRNAVKRVAKKNHAKLRPWFDNSQPEVEQLGTEECENYFQYYKAALGGYGKEEETKFEDKIMRNVMKETMIDKQMIV